MSKDRFFTGRWEKLKKEKINPGYISVSRKAYQNYSRGVSSYKRIVAI
jgi:hypothetical protein